MEQWVQKIRKGRFVRFGLPVMVVIVGGSFGLKYFAEARYEFRRGRMITYEEGKQYGLQLKKPDEKITIESEYVALKDKNLANWENVRGPRPWEDSKEMQELQKVNKPET